MFNDDTVRIWIDEIAYTREFIANQEKRLDRILVAVGEAALEDFSEGLALAGSLREEREELLREIEYNKNWIARTKVEIQNRFNSYLEAL